MSNIIPESVVLFGETVKLRKSNHERTGKLGAIRVDVVCYGRIRVDLQIKGITPYVFGYGKTFDKAARSAERQFLRLVDKRIAKDVADLKTLRAIVKKHGGGK